LSTLFGLQLLTLTSSAPNAEATDCNNVPQILSAIGKLVLHLQPGTPLYAGFHDGHVHNPLGAAAYAFQDDVILPILQALSHDETDLLDADNSYTAAKAATS